MRYLFIGGVGRSGTTVTNHFIRLHQDVCGIPMETKFIVESDGLSDLVDALSTSFSITHRNVTLARFRRFTEQIVRFDPATAETIRARNFGPVRKTLPDFFPNYDEALNAFLHIVSTEFYFPDRVHLISHARAFVESLFGGLAASGGKTFFCEKTPSNLMRIEFLFELFPTAGFIHCIRDPRAVLFSLMKKGWVPDVELGARQVAAVFQRWKAIRPHWDLADRKYAEVRMEDLVRDTSGVLQRIAALVGLPPYDEGILHSAEEHMDRYWGKDRRTIDLAPSFQEWRTGLDQAERDRASAILAEEITDLGYEV